MRLTPPSLLARLGVLTIASLLLGCGGRSRPSSSEPTAGEPVSSVASKEPVTLVIDNSSIWDVRIFAVRSSMNVRLGVVTSGSTVTFQLPQTMISRDVVILADPVGASTRLRTDSFVVWPGNEVKITLEKRLRSYGIAIQ